VDDSNGRNNRIYRHLPIAVHGGAMVNARASGCACARSKEQAFRTFIDSFFEESIAVRGLGRLAKKTGLDKFKQCLDDEMHKTRGQRDVDDAGAVGLSGTSSNFLFINRTQGVSFLPGDIPLTALQQEARKPQGR